MSREIKFRVWDKKFGMMYGDGISVQGDGTFYLERADHDGNEIEIAESEHGELVLMQFTGLLDKNGKELYHDDVVMLLHGGYAEWQPCHVVADDFGTPGFIPIGEPIFLTFERYFMESKAPRAAFEIISNIHLNPELLNQTGH